MKEPSVLDYVLSKVLFWRGIKIEIPNPEQAPAPTSPAEQQGLPGPDGEARQHAPGSTEPGPHGMNAAEAPGEGFSSGVDFANAAPAAAIALPKAKAAEVVFPWRSLAALAMGLAAQSAMEPPRRDSTVGAALYFITALLAIWAFISKEWPITALPKDSDEKVSLQIERFPLLVALPLTLFSFLIFGGNTFNFINVTVWVIVIVYSLFAVWQKGARRPWKLHLPRLNGEFHLNLRFSYWPLLLIFVALVLIFFRFYRLDQVPGEMFSDHAEKLLDVGDILNGKTSIFFPRNTGREAIQMYLTATIATVFNTGLNFISLKLGTALAGLLTLPFVYLLGKEIGGRWVGLLALLMTGFGYWPNLIARIGLRFPLYPLFVAPMLYFLVRGLRYQRRNDFILAGIFLGAGLQGYSPMRIVPFIVVLLVALYLFHSAARGKRKAVMGALVLLAFMSLLLFLPLGRYALENPDMFSYRALTRLGGDGEGLPAPALQIFFTNLWQAWIMPFWDNGNIWVHSVTGRPALDVVSAALYFIGSLYVLIRYIKNRHWIDLFLLVSVPLFMLPSILSLAFPGENPSLNRTGGAYIPIFILCAIGLEGILGGFTRLVKTLPAKALAGGLGLILLLWSASSNFDLVFNQFDRQFMDGAWNTSEIGKAIRGFADSIGTEDTAYVIPFPYWVDTRLVGYNAGFPGKDYALDRKDLATTLNIPSAKLFIFKPEDQATYNALRALYPAGKVTLIKSTIPGKDFDEFLAPAVQDFVQ